MRRLIVRLTSLAVLQAAALLVPAAAFGQRLGGGQSPELPLGRIVAVFLLCVAAAVVAILYLRRGAAIARPVGFRGLLGSLPGMRRLEVISTVRAGQHGDLSLVRCDGREYLLLISAHAQTLLDQRDVAPASTGDAE